MRLFGITSLWLALLAGIGFRATAQTQSITIDSLRLARSGGTYLPATGRALLYTSQLQAGATRLRHYVFTGPQAQPTQQTQRLPGRYEMLSTSSSRHHVLYQLRRRGYDTLLTVVVDTLGRVVAQRREHRPGLLARSISEATAPRTDGFLQGDVLSKKTGLVRFLDPTLHERWRHRFTSEKGHLLIDNAVADESFAWLLITTNARSRLASTTAYCFELATGRVTCRLPLDYQNERRIPGTAIIGPGHSLLLAGYAYPNARASRARTGQLFVTQLHPDSTRSHDHTVAVSPEAGLLNAQGSKVLWQALLPEADGGVRLVGETYTSTSAGGNFAINVLTKIATLGLFRLDMTTLHPRDVLTLRLSPTGQLQNLRVLPLPEGGALTLGGYWPSRLIATVAQQAGVFRLRGVAPDSQRIVLRTDKRLLTMNLQSGQATTVQLVPSDGHLDVWFVEPRQLLLYHTQRSPQRISVERVAY